MLQYDYTREVIWSMISSCFARTKFLYNITSINNLNSILDYGILSKNIVRNQFQYTDISNSSVQNRRDNVYVTKSKMLHDYANLYFNPRNAMLYSRLSEVDNLCILKVDKDVLNLKDTVVSDRNAAVGGAKFMSPMQASRQLDFDIIYSQSWDFENPNMKLKYKSFMMAEVLVYKSIPPQLIKEIWVANKYAYEKVKQINPKVPIRVEPRAFFK